MKQQRYENENPIVYKTEDVDISNRINSSIVKEHLENVTDLCDLYHEEDVINQDEIFDLVRYLKDPEYAYTLESLKIIEKKNIHINHEDKTIKVYFTPTIPNCSLVKTVGLTIATKLLYGISPDYKMNLYIFPGSHNTEHDINKQINDKERVAAAMENKVVFKTIKPSIKEYYPDIHF